MRAPIYDFTTRVSRAREPDELAAAIREITPAVKTIAEELKRTSVIRTARVIARNQRRAANPDLSRR